MKSITALFIYVILSNFTWCQEIYQVQKGTIAFESNAELEIIRAESKILKGLFDLTTGAFAFSVDIQSFQGFNSALQKEHFNENYLESNLYPKADFKGKILDKIDTQKSNQTLRAKGKLTIHGVEKERIISVNFRKQNNTFLITTDFNIPLEDHGITIPRIVYQKISESIKVSISASCDRKS